MHRAIKSALFAAAVCLAGGPNPDGLGLWSLAGVAAAQCDSGEGPNSDESRLGDPACGQADDRQEGVVLGPCGRPISECVAAGCVAPEEASEVVEAAETKTVEAKKDDPKPRTQAQEIKAFVNGQEVKGSPGGLASASAAARPGGRVIVIREGKEGAKGEKAEKGEKKYGFLGVALAPVGAPLADQLNLQDGRGVLVAEVEGDSPADKAGLKRYDVITDLDNQVIYSVEQLKKLVAARKPGSAVNLVLMRKATARAVKATLGGTARRSWAYARPGGPGQSQTRVAHPPSGVSGCKCPEKPSQPGRLCHMHSPLCRVCDCPAGRPATP